MPFAVQRQVRKGDKTERSHLASIHGGFWQNSGFVVALFALGNLVQYFVAALYLAGMLLYLGVSLKSTVLWILREMSSHGAQCLVRQWIHVVHQCPGVARQWIHALQSGYCREEYDKLDLVGHDFLACATLGSTVDTCCATVHLAF